jgi:rhamnosyltransferase
VLLAPRASIVYLTKDGGDLLRRSLEGVFAQNVDFAFEVIVIDSGSTDGTLELVKSLPVRLYSIPAEEFNFGLTRDYGFRLAEGEILVALSQDAIPVGSAWLQKLVEPFAGKEVSVVQGYDVVPEDREGYFWDRMRLFYYTSECRRWMNEHNSIGLSFTSCAIRRSVWERHPLGRVDMSEDKALQKQLVANGYRIVLQPEAKSYHSHMYTARTLAKRCENEGLGWRSVGVRYTVRDMLKDIVNAEVWSCFMRGLKERKIRKLSEVVFPFVRPLYVYKGNRYTRNYLR